MKKNLIVNISQQNHVCVTCDVWSSMAQAYLGMTLHYIDDNLKRHSFVIAFRELLGKQTNDVLAREIMNIFDDFQIDVKKVTNVVTDGGSAFCKAFKVFGKGSDPLVESAELIDEENPENLIPFIQYEDGEQFFSNVLQLQEEDADIFDDDDAENISNLTDALPDDYFNSEPANETLSSEASMVASEKPVLPGQRRCSSHQLNLVEADFVKELSGRAKSAYLSTFNKLQTIWVFPRRSACAKAIGKEILGKALIIPVVTRWNSKFDAVKRIYDLRERINDYIKRVKESIKAASILQELNKEDWAVIVAYIKVMEPIAISLDRLQNEKTCGQGN